MNNTHGVATGRYIREDRISAKAGTGIKRAVYATIANTMAQWEGKRARAAGKAVYGALVNQAALYQGMQREAAKSKSERLERQRKSLVGGNRAVESAGSQEGNAHRPGFGTVITDIGAGDGLLRLLPFRHGCPVRPGIGVPPRTEMHRARVAWLFNFPKRSQSLYWISQTHPRMRPQTIQRYEPPGQRALVSFDEAPGKRLGTEFPDQGCIRPRGGGLILSRYDHVALCPDPLDWAFLLTAATGG